MRGVELAVVLLAWGTVAACGSDDSGSGAGGSGNTAGSGASSGSSGAGGAGGVGGAAGSSGAAGSGGQIVTDPNLSGEQKLWHALTLDLQGPTADETDSDPNPALDFDFTVTFTAPSGTTRVVPGFFAADGDAAESSATSGSVWRARFTPDEEGLWSYAVSFEQGEDIAVDDAVTGSAIAPDGTTGQFSVGPSDKSAPDLRYHGALRYVGKHHLRYAGSQQWFLKGGADSPENLLAFGDFDATTDSHQYAPHAGDWQSGDPSWQGTKGKNLIGALGYLASKGMNSVYFLTMNVTGDGDDVWPWTSKTDRVHFDVSKLEQWELVFSHMDRLGLAMHVVTQETENDQLLDGGDLGDQRKLYYRELIARFAHHPAVLWNLGEENTNTDAQRKAFASFIRDLDAYDHPIVVHTYPGDKNAVYTPLVGFEALEGPSLQNGGVAETHATTIQWLDASAAGGRPWFVALDEIGPAGSGVLPDADDPDHDSPRIDGLWGNLSAGGSGAEWYFGYQYPNDDLDCEDWRSRDAMWEQTGHALELFRSEVPFWEMSHADELASGGADWVLAKPGESYVVFIRSGGTGALDLELSTATFTVRWFDPRNGGALQTGSAAEVTGPGVVDLGAAPSSPNRDWAVLVQKK